MSGTSKGPLQNNKLIYVATSTSQHPNPRNDLEISTFMSNRGNFYGGYSIGQVSVQNNFYNVSTQQCGMRVRFPTLNPAVFSSAYISVSPGQWFVDDLCQEIIKLVRQKCIDGGFPIPPEFKLEAAGPQDLRLVSTNFTIFHEFWSEWLTVDASNHGLSTLLGFVGEGHNMSFQDFPETPFWINDPLSVVVPLQTRAKNLNNLNRFQTLYLHSNSLKHDTSFESDGKTSSFIHAFHNNEDVNGWVNFSDEMGMYQPHFKFSSIRELSVIDFYLTDEKGVLLETLTNNLQVVFRLFY